MSDVDGVNPLHDAMVRGRTAGNGTLLETDAGERIDDARFADLAARFAAALVAAGTVPGDRIAVQVAKSWQALALYVGCVRAGLVFLPLNPAYTETELDYFVGDAEPSALIVDPDNEASGQRLADARGEGGPRVLTLDADGSGSLVDAASEATPVPVVARAPDDLAAILYTSGTTGRSKGAMLTQANLLSNARTLVQAWRFEPGDTLLHALPIFHTHGLFVACHAVLLSGARMIFHAGFAADALVAAMPRATVLMGVPTFYTRLLAHAGFDAALVRGMRLFVSGSAPLLADTHREFEARTGQRILERYGMTETNMNCSNPHDGERRAGTVGPALAGIEVRVRDADAGDLLGTGEVGVLEVRGPNVFAGYWRMPEKTAEELREDGFFITGDLATIDADGYVTIVGRTRDLVISGGYNVYPKEIELQLDQLDDVAESAVVGAPHPDLGEAVVAFVVPRDGAAIDEAAVLAALDVSLARYKRPRRVLALEALPRNAMGKVQKNVLRERVAELFQAVP